MDHLKSNKWKVLVAMGLMPLLAILACSTGGGTTTEEVTQPPTDTRAPRQTFP